MKLPALSLDFRRLALALGGEALQSGLHFALNLVLLAMLPAPQYGAFAFTLVMGGVGITYMRALAAMPASTYIGRARRDAFADFYEGAFGAAALTLALAIAAVAALCLSAWPHSPVASGAAMVGLWSLRSHLRTVGYARGQAVAVMVGDAAFASVGVAASAAALRFAAEPLEGVLMALALANFAGAAALSLARRAAPRFDFRRRARLFYIALSFRLSWSLYSVTTTILQGQGVAFLVVGLAGPAAFAPIAAMLAFFAPMRIFALSLSNMLQAEVSRLAAGGDEEGWRELRRTWTLRACVIALAFGEIGLVALPRLHIQSVEHQPLGFLATSAWALYAIVLAYLLPRILLETRMRFRDIAVITTAGAAVSLAMVALLLKFVGPSYAILGATLGEAVAAVATWKAAARPLSLRRTPNLKFQHDARPDPVACKAEPLA